MFILKIKNSLFLNRIKFSIQFVRAFSRYDVFLINHRNMISQIILVGPKSLGILIVTASFIGIVFTLQVIKEFLYLNASSVIGAVLYLAFIRELSPVLTAVILTGRISSAFTAELAMMNVTEQVDALYLLRVDPLIYLVLPRVIACLLMLPCLNIFFILTSLCSSIFTCFIFYGIHPCFFLHSIFIALSYQDFLKSIFKALIFSLIISIVSCSWGLTAEAGSKNVGLSTTSSVVTSLLLIFILDCVLTYLLFNQAESIIKSL